uniref:Potassium transporter n=1 Tax=Aegilops tauschii subsp. strangulata TaxID=200361 RepID=A0A453BR77_AEGTS
EQQQKKQQQQGGDDEVLEVECALDMPEVVQRQDSLYRDASRAGGASHHGHERWGKTLRLAFQCVGVLYGDIGTSPLYVYSSTFTAGVRHTDDLLGVLSLIIYSFILFTMVKYVYIALRANDDGDVLSAVGGLKEKAPHLTTDQIVWITVAILVALFSVQRFGTDKVGYFFAPVVILWLLLIGGVGVYNLVKHDIGVLRAFNPKYIADYFRRNKKDAWISLGGILLCFTGTEALFADLGYFSIRSIQLSFGFGLVPSVLLAYAGQAAFLRKYPEEVANTFYRSTPTVLFWPTFVLAIAASIIGSQAMISCAFATISHSQALGCFPRVKILHTSKQYQGQLYIPEVNFLLGFAACVVTVAFKTTVVIGEAHGSVYLSSVLYKFLHGGYIPVVISAVLMAVMIVWHYVHVKRYKYELERTVSPDKVRELLDGRDLRKVPGVGLFYTDLVQGIPPVFPHLIEKIPSIHAVLLFVSVKHLPVPHVDMSERFLFRQVEPREHKLYRCVARYGYRDPLEEAKDFAANLVERLQYYIRDVNLYGVDVDAKAGKVSYPSSRCDSMARSTRRSSMTMTMQQHYSSASYTESLVLARARSTSSGAT